MSVSKVVLAKLSPTMDEGKIVKWSKQEGDTVKIGDVMAEIETDKANMEMEALAEGILRKILVPAGSSAPVGSIIGVVAGADEDISALLAEAESAASAAASPPEPEAPAAEEPEAPVAEEPEAEAAAEAKAEAPQVEEPKPEPAPTPRRAPRPSPPAAEHGEAGRVRASPLARKLAAERNISLSEVAGSGPGGRVVKRDVEGYTGATRPEVAASGGPAAATAVTPGEEVPLSNMRRTIAKRLAESKFSAPHFYVTVEIAMDAAMALREQLKESEEVKVSVNDLILKACAKALREHPMVNASWGEDRIVTHGDVHLGVAVALPDGLITPVVQHADRKSVLEIAADVRDLAARARSKRLRPDEYTGATFTVSNLGMFDVTEFTAIINPPNSAILAVGSVRRVPVVEGDGLGIGQRMRLTLSSDHRVVDGALAAQFLGTVRALLETPIRLFV